MPPAHPTSFSRLPLTLLPLCCCCFCVTLLLPGWHLLLQISSALSFLLLFLLSGSPLMIFLFSECCMIVNTCPECLSVNPNVCVSTRVRVCECVCVCLSLLCPPVLVIFFSGYQFDCVCESYNRIPGERGGFIISITTVRLITIAVCLSACVCVCLSVCVGVCLITRKFQLTN